MLRKSNKSKYTATYKTAKYTGNHPHIQNKDGVYYWNTEQSSYIFRPDGIGSLSDAGKVDWYRVHRENLIDLE